MTVGRGWSIVSLLLLTVSAGCGDASVAHYASSPEPDVKSIPATLEPVQTAMPVEAPKPATTEPAMELAVAPAAAAKTSTSANASTTPAVRPPVRTRDGLLDISFDHLKFDIEKDQKFEPEMITPQLKKLDGERVRLRGYILPSFQQSGIAQFILVRDNMECCFGPGAALYDCVVVEMAEGKSTEFTTYAVAVDGLFTLQNYEDADGVVRAVFHITANAVK